MAEVNEIRRVNALASRDIIAVDQEIARVQEELNTLKRLRMNLHDRVYEQNSFLAPIRRLPDELLSNIFAWRIHCSKTPLTLPALHSGITTLGLVCRRWREITMASPALWSEFTVDAVPAGRQKTVTNGILTCLRRAANHSMAISLRGNIKLGDRSSAEWIHALIRSSERWTHLVCSVPTAYLATFDQVRGGLTALRSLELELDEAMHPLVGNLFEIAPKLRGVTIVTSSFPIPWLKLPWDQLSDLTINTKWALDADECLQLLQLCPKLISFDVIVARFPVGNMRSTTRAPISHLRHDNLRQLSIDTMSASAIQNLLDKLVLPALRNLWLDDKPMDKSWQLHGFIQFLSMPPPILTLAWSSGLPADALFRHLKLMSELTRLEIDVQAESFYDLLEHLTPIVGGDRRHLCPKLKRIYAYTLGPANNTTTLIPFLRSRWTLADSNGMSRLKSISVSPTKGGQLPLEHLDSADQRELQQFRDEGLKITFKVSSKTGHWPSAEFI